MGGEVLRFAQDDRIRKDKPKTQAHTPCLGQPAAHSWQIIVHSFGEKKSPKAYTEFTEDTEKRNSRQEKRGCGVRSSEPTLRNQGWGTLKFS